MCSSMPTAESLPRSNERAAPPGVARGWPSMARLLALVLLLGAAGVGHADSFKCGTEVVSIGDTRDQVMAKCGNPYNIERGTAIVPPVAWVNGVPVSAGDTPIEVPVELWLYNFGPTQPMRRVRFASGRVVAIEILGYGSAAG
jgi:Protein of unknown function (DUF2845)